MALAAVDTDDLYQLFATYSHSLDLGDADAFAECFAEDGTLDTSQVEDGLAGLHRGRDELRRFARASLEYSRGRVRQSSLNVLLDGRGAHARASSYVVVTRAHSDATNVHGQPSDAVNSVLETTGMFFDELGKIDGRWVFRTRVFRHDGLPEIVGRLSAPLVVGR